MWSGSDRVRDVSGAGCPARRRRNIWSTSSTLMRRRSAGSRGGHEAEPEATSEWGNAATRLDGAVEVRSQRRLKAVAARSRVSTAWDHTTSLVDDMSITQEPQHQAGRVRPHRTQAVAVVSADAYETPARDEEQARSPTVLLLDERESGAGADRVPADASLSYMGPARSPDRESVASTVEQHSRLWVSPRHRRSIGLGPAWIESGRGGGCPSRRGTSRRRSPCDGQTVVTISASSVGVGTVG
jgi:hypothetical protein